MDIDVPPRKVVETFRWNPPPELVMLTAGEVPSGPSGVIARSIPFAPGKRAPRQLCILRRFPYRDAPQKHQCTVAIGKPCTGDQGKSCRVSGWIKPSY